MKETIDMGPYDSFYYFFM